MGCLLFKESKLNFLENLKTEGYINSRRELTFEKDVHKYLNDLVNRLNLNYDLNLKSLATIKEVKIKTGKDFSRDSEKFILTPIEESFEQIDNRRKELGIYEDKISIGEYNKTQIEKISNQEKVNRLNFFNGDVALYEQEQKELDKIVDKINNESKQLDLFEPFEKVSQSNSFQQFQQSLNNSNTNPILQGNQTNVEEIITQLEKDGLLEIDCKGKLKAEKGLATSFVKGGKWKIIKDLKNYPTHKEGGVDLTISKNGVSIKNGNTQFTAKHGLVIPKN